MSEGMKVFLLGNAADRTGLDLDPGIGPRQKDSNNPLSVGLRGNTLSITRYEFALTAYKEKILVASGGYHHHTTLDIYAYDTNNSSWSRKGALQVPRSHHASCALKDCVYFFAGLDSNQKRLNSIEWLDMETGDRID